MIDERFLTEYENLLDKGYCNCNEMNCIDNNSPRRILNIAKRLQQEKQKYKEVIDKAVDIAWRYGQIDGDHHQKWVTDQMVRALLGSDYEKFVEDYEEDDYEWDIGIAP